jgi:hypothetical protein
MSSHFLAVVKAAAYQCIRTAASAASISRLLRDVPKVIRIDAQACYRRSADAGRSRYRYCRRSRTGFGTASQSQINPSRPNALI